MRFVMLGVLVGCFCLDPIGSVKAASWTSAKFPGEQSRAVQGCVDSPQKVGDWLCIVVRCDHPGSPLGLHLSVPEPDIEGGIELVIDENTFALSMARSVESLPLSNSRCSRASWSYRCNEVRPHDLDSGFSSPVTLQSNFIGELTNEHRKSRGSMCGPIPRRRTPLAAYSEEHRCLLIAQLSADYPTRRGKRRAGTCHEHHRPERCGVANHQGGRHQGRVTLILSPIAPHITRSLPVRDR
jgi:hypothetical protein